MHLAYICIVCHLSAKNYQNRWKFDAVLTKTNLLSFFETRCSYVQTNTTELGVKKFCVSCYRPSLKSSIFTILLNPLNIGAVVLFAFKVLLKYMLDCLHLVCKKCCSVFGRPLGRALGTMTYSTVYILTVIVVDRR